MKLRLSVPQEEDDIDITPLIDCVFLLVLFFMVTSSFIEEAKGYKITLPKAKGEVVTIQREGTDTINVTKSGDIYFRDASGEEKIEDMEALLDRLKDRDESAKQRPIIVRCDAECPYKHFARVKNVLKLAGIETVFEEVEVQRE